MNTQNPPQSDELAPKHRHIDGSGLVRALNSQQQSDAGEEPASLLPTMGAVRLLSRENSSDGPEAELSQQIPAAEKITVQKPAAESVTPNSSAHVADLAQAHPLSPSLPRRSAAAGDATRAKLPRFHTATAINDNRAADILLDQYYTRGLSQSACGEYFGITSTLPHIR